VFFGPWANAFLTSLHATGEFAEAMREAGFDAEHPADRYPVPVFLALLEVARCHLFPSLSPPEGYRRIGRQRLARYFETARGKLMAMAFPLLGPERVIQGIQKFGSSGNNFIHVEVLKRGDNHWRLAFRNTGGLPGELVAGSLEYGLELARTPPGRRVVVARSNVFKEEFDLDASW
jgi:uncharacterized protein (TIGR02265 family)